MAIPGDEEAAATPSDHAASATSAVVTATAAGTITTVAAAVAGIGTATTLTTTTGEGHANVPMVIVSQPSVVSGSSHDLDSQEHMIGAHTVLGVNEFPTEHHDVVTQGSPTESRESPVEEARAAVVPTPLNAIPELNRIRDGMRGITQRLNSNSSSSSEDLDSSSSDEGAVGGVTKKETGRSGVKNSKDRCVTKKEGGKSIKQNSKDRLCSSTEKCTAGKAVDLSSILCKICMDRFCDSAYRPCGHLGCCTCLEEWLRSSDPQNTCHICRRNVVSVLTPVILVNFSHAECFTNS